MTSKVQFHYDKSSFHQEIEVDGAVGGISPTGDKIVMSVFTERPTIPKVVVHELDDTGKLLDEVEGERQGKVGMQRTVQATLHMSVAQAKSLSYWLNSQLSILSDEEKKNDV